MNWRLAKIHFTHVCTFVGILAQYPYVVWLAYLREEKESPDHIFIACSFAFFLKVASDQQVLERLSIRRRAALASGHRYSIRGTGPEAHSRVRKLFAWVFTLSWFFYASAKGQQKLFALLRCGVSVPVTAQALPLSTRPGSEKNYHRYSLDRCRTILYPTTSIHYTSEGCTSTILWRSTVCRCRVGKENICRCCHLRTELLQSYLYETSMSQRQIL